MSNDTLRLICVATLGLSLLILYSNWEKAQLPPEIDAPAAATSSLTAPSTSSITSDGGGDDGDVPQPTQSLSTQPTAADVTDAEDLPRNNATQGITAETDWLHLRFSEQGGNLVEARLKKHLRGGAPLRLLEQDNRLYIAQSGLIGQDSLPNHNSDFAFVGSTPAVALADGAESLTLDFHTQTDAVALTKRYIVHRSSYVVEMQLLIDKTPVASASANANNTNWFAYFQLAHDGRPPRNYSTFLPTFFGAAMYTDAEQFNKIDFDDAGAADYPRKSDNGWIGIIQRYFAAIWLPDTASEREYFVRRASDGGVRVGFIAPLAAGESPVFRTRLFVGAQEQAVLDALQEDDGYQGIGLVVDYGWLTFIALPLFAALSFIEGYVANWGVAIILLTLAIKLLFYPLSSAAYRSMAKMKEEAPRIKRMQEQFGDDKQRLQKEMMDLYRKKKINPLGGCLPILVQIPVFIALYWVLLGSVELRQAPFALWISDLSIPDPYYVLSLIMGVAMFLQTKLSPAPPDPTQAMVMKIMPIGFAGFSILFPSGLVLYWAVNTILSIAQQWYITRSIARQSQQKEI